ncbi:ATP-binding protein [Streptomyces sp. NPDC002644]
MDTDGKPDTHSIHPPRPRHAPSVEAAPPAGSAFLTWLTTPRPQAPHGIWRFGHRPRPDQEPDVTPARQLLTGAVISLLVGWLVWSLLFEGYLGPYWLWPFYAMIPGSWEKAQGGSLEEVLRAGALYVYVAVVVGIILMASARLGRWAEVWRRFGPPARRARRPVGAAESRSTEEDPALWAELRGAGSPEAVAAADRLAADARAGVMRDIDHVRLTRAWQSVRAGRLPLGTFTDAVLRDGAAACPHPSGARDLPVRTARHDLLTGQVRVGAAADDPRNPYAYREAGVALAPDLLATSLVAVGPSGAGKTSSLIRPVAESLTLHALAGRASVVVVGTDGAGLGATDAYDVVIRIGDPDSPHDLDLYGGATDPDEAAAVLAEALAGDLADPQGPAEGGRRAATVLAQLLGPFRAVHDRFPSVPELRALLDGDPAPLAALREALGRDPAHGSLVRELDARERQAGRHGDAAPLLADRIALLDRPAFAGFFDTTGRTRPFSPRALDHPVRVRVDLPRHGHAEASRILARLVLAQFAASVAVRQDRSLFACLVLDEAAGVVTGEAVRAVQRLRSVNAGVVLALRTLDDVPRALRGPLLGSVGCRVALSGLTPWDGQDFAEVWGKEWTEARDVTDRQIVAETPAGKAVHALRRVITGHAPTARAVTVRQVERERWSASDLAHGVPPGHAVISFTTPTGDHTPPLLTDLRG